MAAITILDLLRRNPNFGIQTFSSKSLFSSQLIGASTAASIATPFAFEALFGVPRVAYCDAGAALDEDYFSRLQYPNIFPNTVLRNTTKQYNIELKPLLSAFHWKEFGLISLRSFLAFYLPLLDPNAPPTNDDENPEDLVDPFMKLYKNEKPKELVDPFTKSVKQIIRETSVVTTRRGLERISVHYASPQMAWKLLKDVPKSAARKAAREIPPAEYLFRVSRTTFRGRFLGALASWLVQVGIDIYRFLSSIYNPPSEDSDAVDPAKPVVILGKKICCATVKGGASLMLGSIGAGIGATLFRDFHPSNSKWIGFSTTAGYVAGDAVGPLIVEFCFNKLQLKL